MLNIVMLCCMLGVHHAPPPHPAARRIYTPELRLALLHAAAAGSDAFTTRRMAQRGFSEQDPLVRPLIGVQPTYGRMVPLGVAEVGLTYFLAKRYPKLRWLQLGLAITHTSCAIHNSRL